MAQVMEHNSVFIKTIQSDSYDRLVRCFEPISLADSAKAALMDRSEAKYLCDLETLQNMLPQLQRNYFVLEICDGRVMGYRSLYLDTQNFGLYLAHHNGKPSRHKLRYRQYLHTNAVFFEVKMKSKGRTKKERMAINPESNWAQNVPYDFLNAHRPSCTIIEPKLEVWCRRITLVGKYSAERLTIDLDLAYGFPGSTLLPHYKVAVIMELKYSGKQTSFVPIARHWHLRGQGFSKYSVGCGLLYPALKSNAFKAQRLSIERIENNG